MTYNQEAARKAQDDLQRLCEGRSALEVALMLAPVLREVYGREVKIQANHDGGFTFIYDERGL